MKRHTCALAIAALLPLAPARAETAAADTELVAKAPIAPADLDTLPTVIVTAEKSGKSLMDTGTSAVVLDANDIEKRGLLSAKDVLANIPNIVYPGTGNIAPAIRGVDSTGASQGSDAFIAGSRPRINIQIDGRPLSYNEIIFADTDLWDIDQVEVLRGAQSTLQGRNAIAGTIAIKTADPTFNSEGALRVGGGNYDQRRISAMLSGPLAGVFGDSHVAYRIAADYSTSSSANGGWVSYPSVDDPGDFRSLS
ncbi:MAG: TonB-dependent receptor plug domain-containing protein, partial [Solimonas sp.]